MHIFVFPSKIWAKEWCTVFTAKYNNLYFHTTVLKVIPLGEIRWVFDGPGSV